MVSKNTKINTITILVATMAILSLTLAGNVYADTTTSLGSGSILTGGVDTTWSATQTLDSNGIPISVNVNLCQSGSLLNSVTCF